MRSLSSCFPDDGASCRAEQRIGAENDPPSKETNVGINHQSPRQRPFLRPRWLEFLRQSAASASTSSAQGHPARSSGTTPTPTEASAAGGSGIPKKSASTRVRKDHVRSVIHLASSESRINAFVVISCLEGLLSVASEGVRPAHKGVSSNSLDAPADNDGSKGSGCKRSSRSSTSMYDSGATSLEESGAALCVRLGALPAVLDCLNEHAGHKHIEPLAVQLLSIFASDRATADAIRGNTAVAEACASRMFPVAAIPVTGDASGIGLGIEGSRPSTLCSKNTDGGGKGRASAGPDRSQGHSDDDQSIERFVPSDEASRKHGGQHGGMIETTGEGDKAPAEDIRTPDAFVSSSASISGSCLASPGASKQRPSTSTTTPTEATTAQPFRTPLSMSTTSDRPSAPAGGISHIPRGQMPRSGPVRLPEMDLVFVLSVAVQNSPECQRLVIKRGGITAMLATLRRQISGLDREAGTCSSSSSSSSSKSACNEGDGDARLAEMCLRVMEGLGQPERGRRRLVREGCLETAIAIIARFRWASKNRSCWTGATHPSACHCSTAVKP